MVTSTEFMLSLQRAMRRTLGAFVGEGKQPGFDVALESFLELTSSEYGFIGEVLRNQDGAPFLRTHAITDIAWDARSRTLFEESSPAGLEFRRLDSLFGAVMTTAAPVIANRPSGDPRAGGLPPGHPALKAFLGLPLFRGRELVGMVGLANRPGGYAEELPDRLASLSDVVATLIHAWRAERSRRAAEAALQESEARLRLVADATMDAHYDWNLATGAVWRNDGYLTLFGGDPVPSPDWWQAQIHPEDRARVVAGLQTTFAAREPRWREEYRFARRDGAFAHVLDRGFVIYDTAGKPVRMVGAALDLTEPRRAAERLAEQVESSRRLSLALMETEGRVRREVASVLHDELQQLLVAAQMRVALMSTMDADQVDEAAQETRALLGDCIQATRTLSAELSPPALQSGGLYGALRWLAGTFHRQYGVDVEVRCGEGCAYRDAEERCGAQVILSTVTLEFAYAVARELLFNVVKHSGALRAAVTVEFSSGLVTLRVEDAGVGFDPAVARGHTATGLAHLAERVQALGGTLTVDSSPGAGTRATLRLLDPRRDAPRAPPAAAVAQPRPPPPTRSTRARVLLVDDHGVIREALSAMLARHEDIEVVADASNGREAVERASATQPDVVLMDVSMPVLDGVEATRLITQTMPAVRVIGLSMHDEAVFGPRMREAGAFACISKDAPADALLRVIRSAMLAAP